MYTHTPSQSDLTTLLERYQSAQYDDACSLAISLTERYPSHQFAWKVLGAILRLKGDVEGALFASETAFRLDPEDAVALYNLCNILKELGRKDDAEAGYRNAILLKPDFAEAYLNLGVLLQEQGRLDAAEFSFRSAIALNSALEQCHNNLGNVLRELERYQDAQICYKNAIALKPKYAEAHSNLGIALQRMGKIEDAEVCYKNAIAFKPGFAEAHYNLGVLFQESSRLVEARDSYKKAIAHRANYYEAHYNLGIVFMGLDDSMSALQAAVDSIELQPTNDAKSLFVESLKNINVTFWDSLLSNMVTTALREPWGRPSDMGHFAYQLLKSDPDIQKILSDFDVDSKGVSDVNGWEYAPPKNDFPSFPLLCAILKSGPIADIELEKYCTALRYRLLKIANSSSDQVNTVDAETFYCALAQQCFINEYIYYQTPQEVDLAISLRDRFLKALEDHEDLPLSWLLAIACYFPLYSLNYAQDLLRKPYSDDVKAVLRQQIQEPLEELNSRQSIPSITDVDNSISLIVQKQYEENPYPRWVQLPKTRSSIYLNAFIAKKYPMSDYSTQADDRNLEVLIAGCGTGQHSIGCAQLIKGAKILAVDLSLSSLAYAKRKTLEMGIHSVQYRQADLLNLSAIGRTFDVIESVGVLHHMDRPFEGWGTLVSMLRPNGLMRLGFYSELARRDIVRVRDLINRHGIGSSLQDIRNYRHHLLGMKDSMDLDYVIGSFDFYSASACRDLIFHVQEHRMQLDVIDQFLDAHQLKFLGFDIERAVLESYKLRFPGDPAASNLKYWHIYEQENPHTFTSMYQFLVQKKS
jgi:tetratricopeptide (TPR) repeat protein/2-polyprenyl-3-methyl-5-hydroxy-6-metoxy-1,4-benzoquinol methylase